VEEEKGWEKRNVSGPDLKTATESLLRTVIGSKFQTADGSVGSRPVARFTVRVNTGVKAEFSVGLG